MSTSSRTFCRQQLITITDDTRVIIRNVICVSHLPSMLCNAQTLRSKQYFGRFGEITNIYVNHKTAYIRYARIEHAKAAMDCMNYLPPSISECRNAPSVLNVSYAINRFCAHWLRYEACLNPNCAHLHHPVDAQDLIPSTVWFQSLEKENQRLRQLLDLQVQRTAIANEARQTCHPKHLLSPRQPEQNEEGELNAMKREHDRLRRKHCDLIRDYNVLQQQYQSQSSQLRKRLNASLRDFSSLKRKYNKLQDDYFWTKHELDVTKQSENELKLLLFPGVDHANDTDSSAGGVKTTRTPDFNHCVVHHVPQCATITNSGTQLDIDGHTLVYVHAQDAAEHVDAMEGVETEGGIFV